MLFKAKGNVMRAEWSAGTPTALVVVRSCQKFEKQKPQKCICLL
jgi:hypothetical protein